MRHRHDDDLFSEHFINQRVRITSQQSQAMDVIKAAIEAGREPPAIVYEQISAGFPGHELTSFILNVPVGYRSETVQHEGEELVFVLQGRIRQVVDGQEFILNQGDSMHYLGQHPHSWSNDSDQVSRILWTGKMLHGVTMTAHAEKAAGLADEAARQT